MMRLLGNFSDSFTAIQKFLVLTAISAAGSVSLSFEGIVGTVPTWGQDFQFWGTAIFLVVTVLGGIVTFLSLLFDVQKKWHDARERQRKELQDIAKKSEEEQHKLDELACQRRRTNMICPLQRLLPGIDIHCEKGPQ